MAKNVNDEYYTPESLVKYCVGKTKEVLQLGEDTVYIEPSAGGGAFLDHLPEGTFALDINPQDMRVKEGNFLELDEEYKEGLCVIGNPPFGFRNTLAVKFFKKAITLGDYVSFILPISQLNNQQQMYEFDLVYSEDLGIKEYSGVNVHCCFNIYKRPTNGINTKKPSYDIEGVEYYEFRRGGCNNVPKIYDIGFCRFGSSVGKKPEFIGQYAQEGYLIINETVIENKKELLEHLSNFNWRYYRPSTSTPTLYKWEIMKVIKEFLD